jgi:hypothetical protein
MKNIRYIILLGLVFILNLQMKAQQRVQVKAKMTQNGSAVMLRWAPSTPFLWQASNFQNAGYQLKKYRVYANGQLLTTPVLVTTLTFKVPAYTLDNTPERLVWFQKFMKNTVWNQPRSYFESNATNDESLIVNDEYAILWGAIYGESFSDASKPEDGIIDISNEQQKRFNAALSICDNNFEAAQFVGLGYTDNSIVAGEKYLYEVSPLTTNFANPPLKGSVYIGTEDKEDYNKIPPYQASVAFVDSLAKINWNTSLLDNFYSSYDIYKSTDGTTFTKINVKPLVKIGNDLETSLTFTDSLAYVPGGASQKVLDLNATYYYKVVGKTPFGEYGKYSDVVSGKVRLFLHDAPYISHAQVDYENQSDKAKLRFEFNKKYNPAVDKFLISYSTTSSTTGYTYLPEVIAPVDSGKYERLITAVPITKTTFFRVSAIAKHGDQQDSNPEMVEPIDSIPPLPPTILNVTETARLYKNGDSLLVVKIEWQSDMSKPENQDIDGYRVFRAQNENEEPSQITNLDNITGNFYMDTISYYTTPNNLKTVPTSTPSVQEAAEGAYSLNTKVFYRVRALDKRENQGFLSPKKFLRKPDRIPLPPVVISEYNMGDDGIGLSWSPYVGTDSLFVDFDFDKLAVFRAEVTKAQIETLVPGGPGVTWLQIGEIFDPVDSSFFDEDVVKGKIYAYCVMTNDLSNNKSFSKPFIIEYKPKSNLTQTEPAITAFTAVKETTTKYVKLTWTHTSTNVVEYSLLRTSSADEPLTQFKILEKTNKDFYDLDIKPGSTYKYGIMANYADGTHSILYKAQVTF